MFFCVRKIKQFPQSTLFMSKKGWCGWKWMSEGLVMVAWPKISLPAPLTDLTDGPSGGRRWSIFHSCNVWNIWFVFKNSVNSVVQRGFPELFYNKASVIVFDWKCSSTIIFQCDCSVRCCIASRGGFPDPGHLPGNRLCQGQRESGGSQGKSEGGAGKEGKEGK